MKYVILITPKDEIEIKEYFNFQTIHELVDGFYETCGCFGILDRMCVMFCNEEFLFQDNCAFNSVATALAGQPIYGNVVIMMDGYNEENERDALPMDCAEVQKISAVLNDMRTFIAPTLDELNVKYKGKKPKPSYKVLAVTEEEFLNALGFDNETNNRKT